MWWQVYFATVLAKYVVVMYLHRNYIRNGVESGVESGVEFSEINIRKLRFGINFRDAYVSRHKEVEIWDQLPRRMHFQTHALLDAFLSIFLRSKIEDI
jgi:hypothetical protein